MARADHKRGRFNVEYETKEIHRGLVGWQRRTGDFVDWFRFDRQDSTMDDVYDEGDGAGKVYNGPYRIPVMHVTHEEGRNLDTDTGFYFDDSLHITAAFDQVRETGLTEMEIKTQKYLKDRVIYDHRVFRIVRIEVLGQVRKQDIILSIDAVHVKPDELVNDTQFAEFAANDFGTTPHNTTLGVVLDGGTPSSTYDNTYDGGVL